MHVEFIILHFILVMKVTGKVTLEWMTGKLSRLYVPMHMPIKLIHKAWPRASALKFGHFEWIIMYKHYSFTQ